VTSAPTSVSAMSDTSEPGRFAVYPGFVAATPSISVAYSVAGGVDTGPDAVITNGTLVELLVALICDRQ
jgi:hypothetical protein